MEKCSPKARIVEHFALGQIVVKAPTLGEVRSDILDKSGWLKSDWVPRGIQQIPEARLISVVLLLLPGDTLATVQRVSAQLLATPLYTNSASPTLVQLRGSLILDK